MPLPADAPRVLLSTGKLVGEGFDHPPLDTLILAMPISWKGYVAAVRRPSTSRAREQNPRAHHRLRRRRPSCPVCGCGTGASAVTRRWVTGSRPLQSARTWTSTCLLRMGRARNENSTINFQHWCCSPPALFLFNVFAATEPRVPRTRVHEGYYLECCMLIDEETVRICSTQMLTCGPFEARTARVARSVADAIE